MRCRVNTRTLIRRNGDRLRACGGTKAPRTSLDAGPLDASADDGQDNASGPADGSIPTCFAVELDASGAVIATENGGSVIISAAQDITYSGQGHGTSDLLPRGAKCHAHSSP